MTADARVRHPLNTHVVIEIVVVALCLAAGGVLKGATGAGAPILAVPALAAFFDVRFAVIVMLVPNVSTNIFQAWRFRDDMPEWGLMVPLIIGGMIGVAFGTLALKGFSTETLSLVMAGAVFFYVGLRLAKPHWRLGMALARRLAFPAGLAAGALQGAAGLSAPVSITFLNAMGMKRESFIAGISAFFACFTAVQIVTVALNGLYRPHEIFYSIFALLPVSLAMPLGARLAKRISPATLDRVILATLCVIALKLVGDATF